MVNKINLLFSCLLVLLSIAWLLMSFAQLPLYLSYGQWFSIYAIIISIWLVLREITKN
jgi:hypothetical protein